MVGVEDDQGCRDGVAEVQGQRLMLRTRGAPEMVAGDVPKTWRVGGHGLTATRMRRGIGWC